MNLRTAKAKLVLLVITFFLGTGARSFADTLTYSHVDKASLSSVEQGAIQTGTPKEIVDGDARIVLVYEKDKACPVSSTLPHTGETTTVYAIVGIVLLGGVLFLIKKGNKKGTFLILVLATGAISTAAMASTDVMIAKDNVHTYKAGEVATVTPEMISCYKYVGYIVEKGKTTTTATSTSTSTTASSTTSTSATTEVSTTAGETTKVQGHFATSTEQDTTTTVEPVTTTIEVVMTPPDGAGKPQ